MSKLFHFAYRFNNVDTIRVMRYKDAKLLARFRKGLVRSYVYVFENATVYNGNTLTRHCYVNVEKSIFNCKISSYVSVKDIIDILDKARSYKLNTEKFIECCETENLKLENGALYEKL